MVYVLKVLGIPILEKFKKEHAQSRGPLNAWLEEAKNAQWRSMNDVWARYPKASLMKSSDSRIIFDIKGNDYRLAVQAVFKQGILKIEWIGTHAEYDKKIFSGDKDGN